MPGKHHTLGLIDRIPPRARVAVGGVLAVAFVAGMVLLVQRNQPAPPSAARLVEPPRSAAVVSVTGTPSRTVFSPPPVTGSTPPMVGQEPPPVAGAARPEVSGARPQTRPPAAPSRPVRTTRPATAAPAAAQVAAAYAVASSWDTGFIGGVEVRNLTDAPRSWTVTVRHDEAAGVRVANAWNATLTRSGTASIFTGGPLPAGATVRFGFEATKQVPGRVSPSGCSADRGTCRVS